jgi:hypothetical protein
VAIAFDKQLGSNATGAASSATIPLTTANAVASSGFITLLVGWFGTGTLSSVAGGSLTWAIDKTIKNGSVGVAVVSAQAPSGLAASTVITATFSAAQAGRGISGASWTGVATSAPLDASASATSSATGWTCGAVATIAANDVVIGACMGDDGSDTTSTPTATWTEVPATAGDFPSGGDGETYTMVYRLVTTPASYTPGGTWGLTNTNAGVGVAYMEAGAVAATRPPRSRLVRSRSIVRSGGGFAR